MVHHLSAKISHRSTMLLVLLDEQDLSKVLGKRRRKYALCAYCRDQEGSYSHAHQLLMQQEVARLAAQHT